MLRSGFFNAIRDAATGDYDRKYNADDYSNFISSFIRDGVRRGANGGTSDLRVTVSGRSISIAVGKAIVLGKWVDNTAVYTFTETIELPASGQKRIDRICILVDNVADREASFTWNKGLSTATTPTAPALVNNEHAKEICLAELTIGSDGTISVKDTRGDYNLCGWITTPVGYDDYFTALDEEFNTWLQDKKDTLATVTLFKEYRERIVVNTTTNTITFNIPQYDPTGTDIVQVYTNGIREYEGSDYSLNNRIITFLNGTKVANTEILVYVYKSIDGTGLGTVVDQVTDLENRVQAIEGAGSISEYSYFCNGVNDNVLISNICSTFLNGGTDYKQMRLNVYGTLGISAAVSGNGSVSTPYRYFDMGITGTNKSRKIIVNFANAERITLAAQGTYATIFAGDDVYIENVSINITGGQYVTFFTGDRLDVRDSEFYANTTYEVVGAKGSGIFFNNKMSIVSQLGNAFCLYGNGGLIRVIGGNYYAWTGADSTEAVCFYVEAAQTENVMILNSVNCPQVARSGLTQTNTIKVNSGYISLAGCVLWKAALLYTTDTSKVAQSGTMVISKPVASA